MSFLHSGCSSLRHPSLGFARRYHRRMGRARFCAAILGNDGTEKMLGSASTLWPWWSFTKTVLAICCLRLMEEGLIDLDELRPGKPFTLRQLLQHSAGVPEYGKLQAYHDAVSRSDSPWSRARL